MCWLPAAWILSFVPGAALPDRLAETVWETNDLRTVIAVIISPDRKIFFVFDGESIEIPPTSESCSNCSRPEMTPIR